MEKLLNTVLWILLVIFVAMIGWNKYEENYMAKPFAQPEEHAPPLFKVGTRLEDKPDPWLEQHFSNLKAPIPAQGPAPEGWTEVEASLDPSSCGVCHPQQLADWQGSWHAGAMGPGIMGQLVDGSDKFVAECQRCHAPLTEQHARMADGAENPHYDEALRASAVSCAVCHVRSHQRFGPPAKGEPIEDPPHDGFVAQEQYRQAKFCQTCHDFPDGWKRLGDKLVQETYAEWRHTDYSTSDVTCQSCHMPEGRHLFKGIHDPEITKKAFEATAEVVDPGTAVLKPVTAKLTITNVGAGHRFPTYTTPQVTLIIEQLDASGQPIEGTRQEGYVARRLTPDVSTELYDTRLLPEQSFDLNYSAALAEGAVALAARVEIWPDEAYRRFYEIKLKKPEDFPQGKAMLEQALQASIDSRYVAWERTLELSGS